MKRNMLIFFTLFICLIFYYSYSFSLPHLFGPQKDIDFIFEKIFLSEDVLIASRQSNFKEKLVKKIALDLIKDSVSVKCIGLSKIEKENISKYKIVVIINTCMAWDWDRNVHSFLKKNKINSKLIIITTSASGNWKPKRIPYNVDAISSASEFSKIEILSNEITNKIRKEIKKY